MNINTLGNFYILVLNNELRHFVMLNKESSQTKTCSTRSNLKAEWNMFVYWIVKETMDTHFTKSWCIVPNPIMAKPHTKDNFK